MTAYVLFLSDFLASDRSIMSPVHELWSQEFGRVTQVNAAAPARE